MNLIDDVYALIFSPVRAIGTIIPGVVIEEQHRDDAVITAHPVEKGAAISDHAFLMPATVEMRCGWSDTQGGPGYVREVYEALLDLEAQREPFDVYTGKRVYNNMLIRSLAITTNQQTETALMVVCSLQQIFIVSTQTTGGSKSAQKSPSKTAAEADKGTKQVVEGGSNLIPQRRDT